MRYCAVGWAAACVVLTLNVAWSEPNESDITPEWGQSGATPEPVKDAVREGSWWWPVKSKSGDDDNSIWGNRGTVFRKVVPPAAPRPVESAVPPALPVPSRHPHCTTWSVLFTFDKTVLCSEAKEEIGRFAESLGKTDMVRIEGHTCDVGDPVYNVDLGKRRAEVVRKYLVELGIEESRITAKSFGETQPAVPNDSPENRKLNRRVVLRIEIDRAVFHPRKGSTVYR